MAARTKHQSELADELEQTLRQTTVIRLPLVLRTVGIARSTLYLKTNPSSKYYDPRFPKPIKLGTKAVGWLLTDVQSYVNALKEGY
jgi:predicted DNA-binding transcriptional regulator AlpA